MPPLGRTEPVLIPDEVLDEVAQLTPGDELDHADLPLPDFDHQTVPQLRGRLRTLDLAGAGPAARLRAGARPRALPRADPRSTTGIAKLTEDQLTEDQLTGTDQ